MALYIDSSFLLNIIYSEDGAIKHLEFLNKAENKFSSILLEIESLRSLNFISTHHKKELPENWLVESNLFLEELLSQIHLKNVDIDIISEIKKKSGILELKSLDASHLATAMHIENMISEELIFCSLDDKLRKIAKDFKLKIYPKN